MKETKIVETYIDLKRIDVTKYVDDVYGQDITISFPFSKEGIAHLQNHFKEKYFKNYYKKPGTLRPKLKLILIEEIDE